MNPDFSSGMQIKFIYLVTFLPRVGKSDRVNDCIFCKIIRGESPCHTVWEDEKHLAFLSIFPNTKGFTVVITKTHYPSYHFDASEEVLTNLIIASKKVAKILDSKLEDVGRTGLIAEGFGVDHLHTKLVPMHGTKIKKWKPLHSKMNQFFEKYEGYLSSHDCGRADDSELAELAKRLREDS